MKYFPLFSLIILLTIGNICLPELKYVRLSFLQDILSGEKKCFSMSEIREVSIKKCWSELAIVNVWPQVKHCERLRAYLPTEEMEESRFPDRLFYWRIMNTVMPKYTEKFLIKVMQ